MGIERPAGGVHHQPGAVLRRLDFPQLLDAKTIDLRIAPLAQGEPRLQLATQAATAALGEQRVFRPQLHARLEIGARQAVTANAHVAGDHAGDRTGGVDGQLGPGKPRIDLHPQRFGFGAEPAAEGGEADDIVAVVLKAARQQHVWNPPTLAGGEDDKAVLGHRGFNRRAAFAPVRDQLIQRARVHHRAGQDMRADFSALLDDADADLLTVPGSALLEPDRRRQPRGAAADDQHIELHRLPCGRCVWHDQNCSTGRAWACEAPARTLVSRLAALGRICSA